MYSKMLVLRFSTEVVEKPIVCYLARDFGLTFNILNASILPRKEGIMVLQLSGARRDFKRGVQYLKDQGVIVQNVGQEIKRNPDKCTHCGTCTAVCPTGALSVDRPQMTVSFDKKKCSVCELCIPACPPRAMEVRPLDRTVF